MGSALLSTVVSSASIVFISVLFGLGLLVAWWQFDMQRHAASWAMSFLLASVGHGMRVTGIMVPQDAAFLAMLACHVSVASFAFLAIGFRQRAVRGTRIIWIVWLIAAAALMVLWTSGGPAWRMGSRIVTSLADFSMLLAIVHSLRRARGAGVVARWAFYLYALYVLTVGLAAWLARPGGDISERMFVVILSIGTPAGMIGTGVLTMLIVAADLTRTLRNQARTDPLTGLYNRRAIDDEAQTMLTRESQRAQPQSVAVVVADLDHFKNINDRFGHAVGDKVLRRFAQHLRRQLRTVDLAGRMGGEEFVILMPGLARADAMQRIERLRQGVPGAIGSIVGNDQVTVSFGIALAGVDEAFADVLARADKALYQAKHAGRNRVVAETSSASALSSV
ncbi:GGDEF domain-containing protein [Robbsia sp. KACC 23696]|uniref:GGDEF domain-containing protein n=1 Tax=Robbsia sp. KACC 23696 TaxID=3149231 RepID=UPI00325C13AF